MKKVLLSILCLGSLGAAPFEHKITVAPTEKMSESGKKEYLAKIEVTKVSEKGAPIIIASPKMVCVEGTKAEMKIKSPDNVDVLIISVLVPENNKDEAKASIYMTEDKKVVLSVEEKIKINSQKKFRTWADLREKRAQEADSKASAVSQTRS
ncbi:MAG TPA: hypothetical protein VHK67_07415 [Rhabdochlamydiaceae bacterium]|jgi:hypothetical protein|nr:hypothetical protein [Rhabdochlamydiaceae bacterium]